MTNPSADTKINFIFYKLKFMFQPRACTGIKTSYYIIHLPFQTTIFNKTPKRHRWVLLPVCSTLDENDVVLLLFFFLLDNAIYHTHTHEILSSLAHNHLPRNTCRMIMIMIDFIDCQTQLHRTSILLSRIFQTRA